MWGRRVPEERLNPNDGGRCQEHDRDDREDGDLETAHDDLTNGYDPRATKYLRRGRGLAYDKHRDQIVRHMGFSPVTDLNLAPSQIEIRFRLANGRLVRHN